VYGYHWYAGAPTRDAATGEDKPNPTAEYIGYANAMQLATAYSGKVQWDEQDHSAYFWFYRDQMREWIFFTDLHTFQDRYDLVKKDGLEGFAHGSSEKKTRRSGSFCHSTSDVLSAQTDLLYEITFAMSLL